ncbi:MAG TPA: lysyl oxidase family protein [Actinomycetota bacterium]|nr:lysyl oxidase family protein [Actinomycetota bacterium]
MRKTLVSCCLVLLVLLGLVAPGRAKSPALLLPNLVPLIPAKVVGPYTGLLDSFGYAYPAPVVVNGCLPDEISRNQALRCLRFETAVVNLGRGPLEIAYRVEPPETKAYQVIHRTDGTTRDRFAVASEFHPTHAHFHFESFYVTRLWRFADGRKVGARPLRSGSKSGFCPEDSGGARRHYSCLTEYRMGPSGPEQVVGISAGSYDTYRVHLPDQYLEVTDVPDGSYVLEIELDPDDNVAESNERDNKVCGVIQLDGDDAWLARRIDC